MKWVKRIIVFGRGLCAVLLDFATSGRRGRRPCHIRSACQGVPLDHCLFPIAALANGRGDWLDPHVDRYVLSTAGEEKVVEVKKHWAASVGRGYDSPSEL